MVNTENISPRLTREIHLESPQLDQLLFAWLSELIYLKDAEILLFREFYPTIEKGWRLSARVIGEEINGKRHDLRTDVKAVTYHLFQLTETKEGWTARFVLDI